MLRKKMKKKLEVKMSVVGASMNERKKKVNCGETENMINMDGKD